jgi:hypothetical protein
MGIKAQYLLFEAANAFLDKFLSKILEREYAS